MPMISRFTAALAWVFLVWFAAPLPLLAHTAPEAIRITHVHGLFFSGARWSRAASTGLSGEITRLAVHPDDPATVAIGTSTGMYLSRDGAETFAPVTVEPSGDAIWYGTHSKRAKLVRKSLGPKLVENELTLRSMHGDAVAFIPFNPVVRDEMAITTTRRNVFISRNSGKDWIQIVHEGDTGA
ncbi:MAG: hypothetical protein ABI583_15600 [Betaproteobacteria bacterium]